MIKVYQAQAVNEADRGQIMFELAMLTDPTHINELYTAGKIRYRCVAEVDTTNLDKAFELTNHIDHDWRQNAGVTPTLGNHRSTSCGDILEKNGRKFIVAVMGFVPIEITFGND